MFAPGLKVKIVVTIADPVTKREVEAGADFDIHDAASAHDLAFFASERAAELMMRAACKADPAGRPN